MTDFIDTPGGIERFRRFASTLVTAQGEQGPPGTSYPTTGQYCVATARKSLLGVTTPGVELVSYTFAAGELDGSKDHILFDVENYVSNLHGCVAAQPVWIRFSWNGTTLSTELNVVCGANQLKRRAYIYQYLLNNAQTDTIAFAPANLRGHTTLGANWMAAGGTFVAKIRTTCPQVDLTVSGRIFKVIG